MSDKPEWKKALRESNALGWIAFLLVVIAIGVGTIMFGGAPVSVKNSAQSANTSVPKYLK
jgi:cytochrome c biogenesis factor